jgi:hypothetical protein
LLRLTLREQLVLKRLLLLLLPPLLLLSRAVVVVVAAAHVAACTRWHDIRKLRQQKMEPASRPTCPVCEPAKPWPASVG